MKSIIYGFLITFSLITLSSCEVIEDLKPSKDDKTQTDTTTTGTNNPTTPTTPTNPNNPPQSDYIEATAQDLMHQAYGPDDLQKFDIHIPAKRSPTKTKVVIILHGGSWKELDKGFMKNYVSQIKDKGDNWVIVNANYRLTFQNGIKYDQQIQDLGTLINKILSMRQQYSFSDKIYFIGASAGGHLALAYSYTVDKSKYVKGISVIAAPIDLTSDKIRVGEFGQDIENLIGQPYSTNPDAFKRASPRYQVTKVSPPTIMFYGGKDDFIPSDQGEFLRQQLQANAVINSYNFYPEQGHEWMLLSETIDKTLVFFGDDNTRN
ncbi:alpha/beta hydrolase [Emticicia sp. BO119]|uniref:alpha/beta hydrolase n=1 Tax=Emticicia sp. BO119 TaxID=2757768 RepID=UPI0015F0AACF|nr:alpha/beta hydrolase [Emticicia sp. BO119]MBA4849804.1 alpha/beta hydrolase [Emticicia sp. BO119]